MTAPATDSDSDVDSIERLDFRPTCEWRTNGVRCSREATHYIERHDCTSKHRDDRGYSNGLSCWPCLVDVRRQFDSVPICCRIQCRNCGTVFVTFADMIPVIKPLRGES